MTVLLPLIHRLANLDRIDGEENVIDEETIAFEAMVEEFPELALYVSRSIGNIFSNFIIIHKPHTVAASLSRTGSHRGVNGLTRQSLLDECHSSSIALINVW